MKNNKIKEEENTSWFKKIIIGLLYLGYLVYLYILLTNWELASRGSILMGVFQVVIPLSAVRFVDLVLNKKIKTSIPD